jgi:hypothetical protein
MSLALSRIERQPQTVTAACPNHNPGPPQPPDDTGQAIRPTRRNRIFGSLAELGGWHRRRWMAPGDAFRVVNEPRGQSANRRRHKPALSRTGKGGWHRQKWMAPTKVDGTGLPTSRLGTPPIAEGTNRLSAGSQPDRDQWRFHRGRSSMRWAIHPANGK